MALLATFGLGDTAALQDQVNVWVQTLNGLNRSLVIARQTNNRVMEDQVRSGITWVLQQMVSLNQQLRAQDLPAGFLVKLDQASDLAIKVATDAGGIAKDLLTSAGGIARGASRTLNWLPFIAIGALVVLGLGFAKGGLKVEKRF